MTSSTTSDSTSLVPYEADIGAVYTLEDTAGLTGVARRMIVLYSRAGLLSPVTDPETSGWNFNGEALRTVRRIEQVRAASGANLFGIKLILDLMEEVEALRTHRRFER